MKWRAKNPNATSLPPIRKSEENKKMYNFVTVWTGKKRNKEGKYTKYITQQIYEKIEPLARGLKQCGDLGNVI